MEIWKNIEGYEGLYEVSNYGNVKSLKFGKEKILKPAKNKRGYLIVCLYKQSQTTHYIHRLVAEAFIDNSNNFREINHKDEDKTNNVCSNLEWCDRKHNINYGTRNQRAAESRINHPKRSKQVLCVETGVIYPSTMEAQRQLGFAQQNISNTCNGKCKTCGGYTWRYVL